MYLTAWTRKAEGRKYWVQRRGHKKSFHLLRLDCCVSGRLEPNEIPFDGMVRGAGEEANLPAPLMCERSRFCDVLATASELSNQGQVCYQCHTQYV